MTYKRRLEHRVPVSFCELIRLDGAGDLVDSLGQARLATGGGVLVDDSTLPGLIDDAEGLGDADGDVGSYCSASCNNGPRLFDFGLDL